MIGLSYNENSVHDLHFSRPNSFAQWTIAAAPGHEVFEKAVERVMSNLEYIARMQGVPLEAIELSEEEVVEATGSGVFTDAVLEVLRDQTGDAELDIKRFDGMMLPTLFGDVLVMPVNAFAAGQRWEEVNGEFGDVLAVQEFDGSEGNGRVRVPVVGEEEVYGVLEVDENELPRGAERLARL